MNHRLSAIAFCVCLSSMMNGQLLDTIGTLLEQEPRLVIRLDGRGAFISNRPVRMLGFKVGLEHAKRFQYGIGYGFLRSEFVSERTVLEEGSERLVDAELKLRQITPYVEYAFFRDGPWQVSIPVQLGIGWGFLTYDDLSGKNRKMGRTFLMMYEPAMTAQYRFLRYFGISAGLGYRLAFKRKDSIGEQLSAPIYLFGFKVFFDDLRRDSDAARPKE